MKKIIVAAILSFTVFSSVAIAAADSSLASAKQSVLVIPYMPAMHLSDADPDLSHGSEMPMPDMRKALRDGLIKSLNRNFAEIYDMKGESADFVANDNRETDIIYHTVVFESDSVYPLKYPSKFALRDTIVKKNGKVVKKIKPESKYINVGIYDPALVPDLSKKYDADYVIFINELDIKTHFEDCLDLAMKIYRRDYLVHYSIFDKLGNQVYGDIAVVNSDSNTNDVNDIVNKNFPVIADYVLNSLQRVEREKNEKLKIQ